MLGKQGQASDFWVQAPLQPQSGPVGSHSPGRFSVAPSLRPGAPSERGAHIRQGWPGLLSFPEEMRNVYCSMVSNGHGVTKRAEVHLITKVPGDERFERKRRAAASGSFLCDSHSPLRIQCLRENSGGRSPAWEASPVARAGARREPPGSSVRLLWGGSGRKRAPPRVSTSPLVAAPRARGGGWGCSVPGRGARRSSRRLVCSETPGSERWGC